MKSNKKNNLLTLYVLSIFCFFGGGFVTVGLKDKARPWDQARSNYSSETPKWVTLLATDFNCDDVAKEVRARGG